MIKELLEITISRELFLYQSDNIKFISVVDPLQHSMLLINIEIRQKEEESWDINAVISWGETIFLKFKGKFRPDNMNQD